VTRSRKLLFSALTVALIGEVQRWFREEDLEFVRGVPSVTAPDDDAVALFAPSGPGTAWDHFRVRAAQIVKGDREGGFFIMIARKSLPAGVPGQSRARELVSL
jgi:hypothetical protein